jgi:hypothetical protein
LELGLKNQLVSEELSQQETQNLYMKLLPEPVVSLITFPFAYFGPGIWAASWLLLIPVTIIVKRIINKNQSSLK